MEHWNSEREILGYYNAISYPNGDVTLLDCYSIFNSATKMTTVFCKPFCDIAVDSIIKYNDDCWACTVPWTSVDYDNGKIYSGASAMGHEGYIVCVDESENLQWAIIF